MLPRLAMLIAFGWPCFAAWPQYDFFTRPQNVSGGFQSTRWTLLRGTAGIVSSGGATYFMCNTGWPCVGIRSDLTGLAANHFAEATAQGTGGPAVRVIDANNYYDCVGGSDANPTRLRRTSGGTTTVLASNNTAGQKADTGDLIRLSVSGASLTCTVYSGDKSNTVKSTLAATDSTHATGGVGIVGDNAYSRGADNWVGGNIGDEPPAFVQRDSYYVSPSADAKGDGSIGNPYNLFWLLNHPAWVQAGATIWLRGGTYEQESVQISNITPHFPLAFNGTETDRVTVRAYPGEQVVLASNHDGSVQKGFHTVGISGNYLTLRDVRVTDLDYSWRALIYCGSNPSGQMPPRGVTINNGGLQNRLIHITIHDVSEGVSEFASSLQSSAYGLYVWGNGWDAADRGHGPGLYGQNNAANPQKYYEASILAHNGIYGFKWFSQTGSDVSNITSDTIVAFGNNLPGIEVQGANPNNLKFRKFRMYKHYVQFNMDNWPGATGAELSDSHIDGQITWQKVSGSVFRDNVVTQSNAFVDGSGGSWHIMQHSTDTLSAMFSDLSGNVWYRGKPDDGGPSGTGKNNDWRNNSVWRTFTQYDADLQAAGYAGAGTNVTNSYPANGVASSASSVNHVYVDATDRFEPGRGLVTIYNWKRTSLPTWPNHPVDVSAILNVGDPYEVWSANCLPGLHDSLSDSACIAVATGTYSGGEISIPMNDAQFAKPRGWVDGAKTCKDSGGNTITGGADWSGCACPAGSDIGTPAAHTTINGTKTDSTEFQAFLIRRRQTYRSATAVSLRLGSATSATVEWGYLKPDGSYVWGIGPAQTLSNGSGCTSGRCSASIPQAIGKAYYRVTYDNGIVTPAMLAKAN